jgi:hypothetical protein
MDPELAEAIVAEVEKALGYRVSAASVTGDVTAAPPPDPGPCSCDCHSCDDLPPAVVMTAGGPRCRGCLPNGVVNPSFGPPPTDDEIRAMAACVDPPTGGLPESYPTSYSPDPPATSNGVFGDAPAPDAVVEKSP